LTLVISGLARHLEETAAGVIDMRLFAVGSACLEQVRHRINSLVIASGMLEMYLFKPFGQSARNYLCPFDP